jgi:polysaccharide deacetylase 2 family uncharacterized protein YibQ
MNQKKSRKKSKKSSKSVSNKKLVKIFLLLFLIAFLVSLVVYFKLKEKNTIKNIPDNSTISSSEIKPETLFPKVLDKDPSSNQLFEEKFNLNEENKFEEYTNELEKVIEDKLEREDFINKENEIIQKKVEEIKEEKAKELNAKKETKEQNKNKEKEKIDEKSIITNKDSFTYDKKSKPKIAIVIDDVSSQAQKDAILAMGYKITMAFFPPTSGHPDSARIAQNLPFYMIHFPMQASPKFKSPETHTLNITDSYETIENRVKQLRDWYPNAVYTNNHTGSVFTENEEAMDKLFRALKRYNFIFVDSRTSGKSVAKKYAQKYNMPYIVRNIFIDNEENYQYIQNQLKQAIEIAKKQGYAIAIGHPHSVTLKVLKDSKHLLKDVEPIFVNQLPYL